jgi:molybdopterin-containing oxidoreductase family iron-sulfur binding subunit
MKRVWQHPPEPTTGKRYWTSLGQLTGSETSKNLQDREFQDGAEYMKDEEEMETSRRTFLKLMSASTAMAGLGLASCRRPETYLKPYSKMPEWVIPGKILYYATAMPRAGGGTPMVVHTSEGRPTHLQGNKLHADSNGGLDSQAQASVLGLYDPDRARAYSNFGKPSTRDDFFKFLDTKKKELAAAGGKGLAILTDEVVSPTRLRLIGELQKKFPAAKVHRYEAFGPANVRAAYTKAFADGVMPVYHFDKADRVFAIDSDFLGLDRVGGQSVGQFMSGRKANTSADPMNRLYAVESNYTITGGMADHRMRVHASQAIKVAAKLAELIGAATKDAALTAAAASVKTAGYQAGREDYNDWMKHAASDLVAAKGKSIVIAGSQQSEAVQLLTAAINQALGAYGATIELKQTGVTAAQTGSLADLAKDALAGAVDTLLIVSEADPSFQAPADLKWPAAQDSIKTVIVHSTRHRTATARKASWAVPATHYLEQWGDTRGFEGTYSIVQPMILPLFGGVSDHELLNALLSNEDTPPAKEFSMAPALMGTVEDPGPGYKLIRDTFAAVVAGSNDDLWNNALRDGFVANTAYPAAAASFNAAPLSSLASVPDVAPPSIAAMELTFLPCAKVADGRYINSAWLQEAPDPVSKVTWDNAALISVKTAKDLKVDLQAVDKVNVISVEIGGVVRYYPVIVIPGHADYAVTLTVGYGQRGTGAEGPGRVGQGTGFDVYGLRTSATPYFAAGAKVSLLTSTVTEGLDKWTDHKEITELWPLGVTQEHHSMYGRALVREGTQEDWKQEADFVMEQGTDGNLHGGRKEKEEENAFTFYKPVGAKKEDGTREPHLNDDLHQWGMVIDLNSCTGCTSCLVACQSENNIPVVGKDQVIRGREMHWIRMDRYFATDLNSDAAGSGRKVENVPFSDDNVWNEDEMDDPSMLVEPVGCQHCEAAPCETVCPVNATVHSPDGLNVMVYNRCIGTRYCANNCPFKARRFNFFDYNKRNPLVEKSIGGLKFNNLYAGPLGDRGDTELGKLQKNPNVTVRMRGVIEKCTYCLQRIEGARIDARAHARKDKSREQGKYDETLEISKQDLRIPTNGVKTACQEACPAEAIHFGNILDKESDIAKAKANSRNYELLGYLSVRARTTYLARIKNPNPELIAASPREAKKVGQGSKTRPIALNGHAPAHH